jgi:hypothetical protein
MGWISRFLPPGEAEPANPWDETVLNGAPYHAQRPARSGAKNSATPGDGIEVQDAEEIKRRQVSLAVRYVAAVRARAARAR